MANKPIVTCVGVITVDVIAVVNRFPSQEGRIEADDVMITGGGPASNAAVVLAKQGIPTAVVGCVGADDSGKQAVALLADHGIDVSGITIDPSIKTQTSCIVVDRSAGTRSIITSRANPLTMLSTRAQQLIAASQWMHVDHLGYRAGVDACSLLNSPPLVSLDSGNAPIADLDLSAIDLYVPTVESLTRQAGTDNPVAAAQRALEAGCHAVVATAGSEGSQAWWDEIGASWGCSSGAGEAQAVAYRDIDVVSTLGAGDVFHGALLAGLIHGFEWSTVLHRANTIAALSCTGRDGRENVPTREELDAVLAPSLPRR